MVTVCTGPMESSSIPSACRIASIAGLLELTKLGTMFDSVVTKGEFSEPRELPCLLRMMASGAAAGLLRVLAGDHSPRHRHVQHVRLRGTSSQGQCNAVPPRSLLAVCVIALCE